MSYLESSCFPKDIFTIVAKFLNSEELKRLSIYNVFRQEVIYKDFYIEEITGYYAYHENYREEVFKIFQVLKSLDGIVKFCHICKKQYIALLKKINIQKCQQYAIHGLKIFAENGNLDGFQYLLSLDKKLYKREQYVVLKIAAWHRQLPTIKYLIELHPKCIRMGERPYEALTIAAKNGCMSIVTYLAPLTPPHGLIIPLIEASKGQYEVVKYLTTLEPTIVQKCPNAFLHAAVHNQISILELLMDIHPAGYREGNYQALSYAASNGHVDIIKVLLEREPSSIKLNNEALRWSVTSKQIEAAKYLIRCGADIDCLTENILRLGNVTLEELIEE
jgi:hypothetical protein